MSSDTLLPARGQKGTSHNLALSVGCPYINKTTLASTSVVFIVFYSYNMTVSYQQKEPSPCPIIFNRNLLNLSSMASFIDMTIRMATMPRRFSLISRPRGPMSSPLFKTNCLSVIVSTSLWPLSPRLGLPCLRPNSRIWLTAG